MKAQHNWLTNKTILGIEWIWQNLHGSDLNKKQLYAQFENENIKKLEPLELNF